MRKITLVVYLTVCLLLVVSNGLLPKQPRYDWIYEFGKKPDQFCINHIYQELPVKVGNIWTSPHDYKLKNANTEIDWIKLTASGHEQCTGVIWYKEAIDYQNGFVSEFNLESNNPTCNYRDQRDCKIGIFGVCIWSNTYQVETNCGADGFAFVIQQTSYQTLGAGGFGLGYRNTWNALAIEFDTHYDQGVNDPTNNIERHISVILKKGQADANEINSIAWNDKPLNFKSNRYEAFLFNPRIRIEYLNKYLRVFINDVLQVGYYDPLHLPSELELSNNKFFMGITAATSSITTDQILRNWQIRIVRPAPRLCFATTNVKTNQYVKTNEVFVVSLNLRDQCNNRYVPIENFDSPLDIDLPADTNFCSIVDRFVGPASDYFETGASYLVSVKCTTVGDKNLQFTYKAQNVREPVKVRVGAGPVETAEIVFPNGPSGNIDKEFVFNVIPYDGVGQRAETTVDIMTQKVAIEWPILNDYRSDYIKVTFNSDGSYQFSIKALKVGQYKIKNFRLFLKFVSNGEYYFDIEAGDVDPTKSFVTTNEKNKDSVIASSNVVAGTGVSVVYSFRDRENNVILGTKVSRNLVVTNHITNGDPVSLPPVNQVSDKLIYNTDLVRVGSNVIKPTYSGKELMCQRCVFVVEAGPGQFKTSELYQYNEAKKDFSIGGPNFALNKGAAFSFLFVLQDAYGNRVNSIDATKYSAVLSGNFMDPINLCENPFGNGLQIAVCNSDLPAFNRLVGRKDYLITVNNVDSTDPKTWNLEIISDGSDSDAGNGPVFPQNTKYTWIISPPQGFNAVAGATYSAAIQLCTKQGTRYNDWLPDGGLTTPLQIPLDPLYSEKMEPLVRGSKPGIYILNFNLKKGWVQNKIFFEINKVRAIKFINLQINAGPVSNAKIVSNILDKNTLVDGNVYNTYLFDVKLTDDFKNDAEAVNFKLAEITATHMTLSSFTYKPTCNRKARGLYGCELLTQQFGYYNINSIYFKEKAPDAYNFYKVFLSRGAADVAKSTATITSDVAKLSIPGIEAGQKVTFRIIPRDKFGGELTKKEIDDNIADFLTTLRYPDTSVENIKIKQTSDGAVEMEITPTIAGSYQFTALIKGNLLTCSNCAFTLIASDIDTTKTTLNYVKDRIFTVIPLDKVLILENSKVLPVFALNFQDKYGNPRIIENGFGPFEAVLRVPKSSMGTPVYNFFTSIVENLPRMAIPDENDDNYQGELANTACSFEVTSKHTDGRIISIKVPKVTLVGGVYDDIYTTDAPVPEAITFSPNKIQYVAGNSAQFSVELRAANGKLYIHTNTNGWYVNVNDGKSLKLKFKDEADFIPGVKFSNGKLKGTYFATVTSTKAYDATEIQVTYLNPEDSNKAYVAKNTVGAVITPANVNYLVVNKATLSAVVTAGQVSKIEATPFDKYSNLITKIENIGELGVSFTHNQEGVQLKPSVVQAGNGIIIQTCGCQNSGVVTLKSLGFMEGKNIIPTYTYQVIPAAPDAVKSTASLTDLDIVAGKTVQWRIYPVDAFGNKITIDLNLPSHALSMFTANEKTTTDTDFTKLSNPQVAADKSYYFFEVPLKKAGTHNFNAYYNGQQISSTIFRVKVSAGPAFWPNTKLTQLNSVSNSFAEFDGTFFSQNIQSFPEFGLNLYDEFQNLQLNYPDTWSLSFYLTDKELGADGGIFFCQKNNVRFIMCNDDSIQINKEKFPKNRWPNLIPTEFDGSVPKEDKIYTVSLRKKGETQNINAPLVLLGEKTASNASNLPMDIQNTVIIPQTPLVTKAGVQTRFNIEIRTTNKNLIKNDWFDNPDKSITLAFSKDDKNADILTIDVEYGESKGKYIVFVTSKRAYPESDPNVITVLIENTAVKSYQPKLVVLPGSIDQVLLTNDKNDALVSSLPSQTVDAKYSLYLKALDVYGNFITLTPEKNLNLEIKQDTNTVAFTKTVLPIGTLMVSFQPTLPSQYSLVLSPQKSHPIAITQGAIAPEKSSATLDIVAGVEIEAGKSVSLVLSPFDKWGNKINLDDDTLKKNTFTYSFKLPTSDIYATDDANKQILSQDRNSVAFNQVVIYKGKYVFKASINGINIDVKLNTVAVKPTQVDLDKTILLNMDETANKFVVMNRDIAQKEDNNKTIPIFRIQVRDQYLNQYDKFPEDIASQFVMTLSGNVIPANSPVNFVSDGVFGDSLQFTLDKKDPANVEKYQTALFRDTPYDLFVAQNSKNIKYKLILLGEGEGDKGATKGEPEDLSKFWFSTQQIQLVAGEYTQFVIEIRTASGKRLADAKPVWDFKFDEADKVNDGKYKAEPFKGDLRGRYVISVTATQANERIGDTVLTVIYKGKEVPTKVNVKVVAGPLARVSLARDLNAVSTADNDYPFELIPLDKYDNVAVATEKQVNLDIDFPDVNGVDPAPEYLCNVNDKNGFLEYKVKSRISGEYKIASGLLDSGKVYLFNVVAGVPSRKFSSVSVTPLSIIAGEEIKVQVTPVDAYNNRISPSLQKDILTKFLFQNEFETKLTKYDLAVEGEFLTGKFSLTKIGKATVSIQVNNQEIPCASCIANIFPADIDVKKTKFLREVSTNMYVPTQDVTIGYGSQSINFIANLFDKYENPISVLYNNQSFSLQMRGNNMDSLTFDVKRSEIADLIILSKVADASAISRLVPAKNYILEFKYTNKDKKIDDSALLNLEIEGKDTGAGNGPYVGSKTYINPVSLQIEAGTEGLFVVELRTSENKRFNGVFDIKDLTAIEAADSAGTEKLTINVYSGEYDNQFRVGVKGTKTLPADQTKKVLVKIRNEEVSPRVAVTILPGKPDVTKTRLVNTPPITGINGGKPFALEFEMSDIYGNKYNRKEFSPSITGKVSAGKATFGDVTLNSNGNFIMNVIPIYPPRYLEFSIYYKASEKESFVLNQEPIITQVLTVLDITKTEFLGTHVSGVPVGDEMRFTILLKDTTGFCYETTNSIKAKIRGPYLTNDLLDDRLNEKNTLFNKEYEALPITAVALKGNLSPLDLAREGYDCQKYYEVAVPKGEILKTGWYQIDAYIIGINNNNPIKTARDAFMTPAETDPRKSVVVMPSMNGKAPQTLSVVPSTKITFQLWNLDIYGNRILENRVNVGATGKTKDSFDFKISNLVLDKDYSKKITFLSNGTWSLEVQVNKTGTLNQMIFVINNVEISYINLEKYDCSQSIIVIPGRCSYKFPRVDNSSVAKVTVGEKNFFSIDCRDDFDNDVVSGGDKVVVLVLGKNITGAGDPNVKSNVDDKSDGLYLVDFTITWPGTYEVNIMVNGNPYYSPFNVTAVSSACPVDKPFVCINSKDVKCVASYKECGLKVLDCPTNELPIRCKVWGVEQCVKGSWECDCTEQDTMKCDTDQKCVAAASYTDICSTITFQECPSDLPYSCSDGSCRMNSDNCPSQPGCPPGFKLCPDQTCIQSEATCTEFTACPVEKIYKCEDQSCVENPGDCPTRITCPLTGQIICPDKTCVDSELKCKLPNVCSNGLILCPDQSCRKSLSDCPQSKSCPVGYAKCVDGQCRTNCLGITPSGKRILLPKGINNKLARLLQSETLKGESCTGTKCSTGECVSNLNLCPTEETCPKGYLKCEDSSCVLNKRECVVRICKENQYRCWDGKCVSSPSQCSTRSSCPETAPVKCHDGSCKLSQENCPPLISCPPYSPYRCANGECRTSSLECPTLIICPEGRPVKCSDNTCEDSKENCADNVEKQVCAEDKILCPDGSCARSKHLCPTLASCNLNQIRCWDGSCSDSLSTCPKYQLSTPFCPNEKPLRCSDGSCVSEIIACPAQAICPLERPIKCDDGTCKESIVQCAKNTDCSYGMTRCPDGTCTDGVCGTPITCPLLAPYLCYDSTCKRDPRDCPNTPTCTDKAPILCPDGTCVSQRVLCRTSKVCEPSKPIRCPDDTCVPTVDKCTHIIGCPTGKFLCDDGSCAYHPSSCAKPKCPSHLNIKCDDGFCVSDIKFCDRNNSCPFNTPLKCNNGLCVTKLSDCPNNNNYTCPQKTHVICPDGSCAFDLIACPLANGCPTETPLKCANGLCINPNETACPIAICPKEAPVKCLNGICAESFASCPSNINSDDFNLCKSNFDGNIVPCADGRCVASSDQCRPLSNCPAGTVRCGDGSCRYNKLMCPLANVTCPSSRPFRCQIGSCMKEEGDCPKENGCPNKSPTKCEKTGSCAKNQTECEKIYENTLLPNKCPINKPNKCSQQDGNTVCQKEACLSINKCEKGKIQCVSGECVDNNNDCRKKSVKCEKGQIKCPDGKCANDMGLCQAVNGCDIKTPYRCADGSCKATPFDAFGEKGCQPTVKCPLWKPYLCADGECQGAPEHCRTQYPCPDELPIRCPDQTCASSIDSCKEITQCPITSPVLCSSGICASTSVECQHTKDMFCPEEKPFYCVTGVCAAKPTDCVGIDTAKGYNTTNERRRLQPLPSNQSIPAQPADIDTGCTAETPARCSDGSCRKYAENCVPFEGCWDPQYPFRCRNGTCSSLECNDSGEENICAVGLTRCVDGICRRKCQAHHGCPKSLPLHCPNGFCAKDRSDCVASSSCKNDTQPFRCSDGTCVSEFSQCQRSIRTFHPELIMLTVSPIKTQTLEFIQKGSTTVKYGKIIIPAGATLKPLSSNSSESSIELSAVLLKPVPESNLQNYTTNVHNSREGYIKKNFPLSSTKLGHFEAVRSPVVSIQIKDRNSTLEYRFPIILELNADLPLEYNKTSDFCLAQADEAAKQWNCVSRQLLNDDSTNKFSFPVNKDGVYSVIYNPAPVVEVVKPEECNWVCQNKGAVVGIVLGLFVALLVGAYVIWRISRYVGKYRAAKVKMEDFQRQISELENTNTDVVGQSKGDKIRGIQFNVNPMNDSKLKQEELDNKIKSLEKQNNMMNESVKEMEERNQQLENELRNLRMKLADNNIE